MKLFRVSLRPARGALIKRIVHAEDKNKATVKVLMSPAQSGALYGVFCRAVKCVEVKP